MPQPAWMDMRPTQVNETDTFLARGKKLVVQMVETFQEGGKPTFVNTLDAVDVAKKAGMPLAPIMIYGDDVTHLLTEDGICVPIQSQQFTRTSRHDCRRCRSD